MQRIWSLCTCAVKVEMDALEEFWNIWREQLLNVQLSFRSNILYDAALWRTLRMQKPTDIISKLSDIEQLGSQNVYAKQCSLFRCVVSLYNNYVMSNFNFTSTSSWKDKNFKHIISTKTIRHNTDYIKVINPKNTIPFFVFLGR